MKYSNLEIYKELKYIDKCFTGKGRRIIDECAEEFYKNYKPGILNYLISEKYILMNSTISGRDVPYISAVGNDFLKKGKINCILNDYIFTIKIVVSIISAIITGLFIWVYTHNYTI